MRIVVVVDHYPTRSQTFVAGLVAGLVGAGHEVAVVPRRLRDGRWSDHAAPSRAQREHTCAPALERVLPGAWPVGALVDILRPGSGLRRTWDVTRPSGPVLRRLRLGSWASRVRLAAARADVVHTHFLDPAVLTTGLREVGLVDRPVVASFHGTDLNVSAGGRRAEVTRVFETATVVTVGSPHMAARAASLGATPSSLEVWPQGIDTRSFAPPHTGGDERSVVTVARLVPFKAVDVAIRAMAPLLRDGAATSYTIIGEGPERGSLEGLVDRLGVAGKVAFLGAQPSDRVRAELGRAAAFLLPGRLAPDGSVEGQGVAVLEAQAMGTPVVVGDVGGLPSVVDHGRTGFVVRAEDPGEASRAVRRLLTDRPLREALAGAGPAWVAARFSLDAQLAGALRIYADAIRRHRG